MKKIVFYSWQSDLPNSSNRGLIEEALKKAVKSIGNDESIKVDPVVDRDTSGIGGSPDISKTIFEKIIKSDVFVADVSIINKDYGGRKVPNPNVLIELGYALKSLGYEKVILVMNTGFGEISLLPFDLKTKRVLSYDTTKDKKQETKILSDKLKFQLQTIFKNKKVENIEPDVINTIKKQERDRIPAIRNYMTSLSQGIDKLYPGDGMMDRNSPDPKYDEKIIDALEKTQDLVLFFRDIIEEISVFDDIDSLKEIFKGFRPILQNYKNKKENSGGIHHKAKHDYYRFLGNELFVILTSILLREERWRLLRYILEEPIIINNAEGYEPSDVYFTYFSQQVHCFYFRKERIKSTRTDLRYDFITERRKSEVHHTKSALDEYTSADLFLFLKGESEIVDSTSVSFNWRPWSLLNFNLPEFVLLAAKKNYANEIAKTLGLSSSQDIKVLLQNKIPGINNTVFWDNPIKTKHINQIGSR